MRRLPPAARRRCILAGCVGFFVITLLLMLPLAAAAQGVRGEASLNASAGYGRLVITLAREVEAQVRVSGNVLAIFFNQPVNVPVDRLPGGDYIGAARRDPDGRALRFALARKVRVNSIAAAERLYVDLLPDTWTGDPPGLPREVVEDLARRTREAERKSRQEAELAELRKIAPVRVRVALQPTFTRYVFEMPQLVGVTTERGKDKLTLKFAKPLQFDLADAKLAPAPGVQSVVASFDLESSEVRFAFAAGVDVRSFREDLHFVVDVAALDARATRREPDPLTAKPSPPAAGPLAGAEPPQTVPARNPEAKLARAATPPPVAPAANTPQPAMPPVQAPAAVQVPAAVQAPPVQPATDQASRQAQEEKPAAPLVSASKPVAPIVAAEPASPPAVTPAPPAVAAPAPAAAAPAQPPRRDANRPVAVELRRQGDSIRLTFPFGTPTPAAVFQRADALWLVFDTTSAIDLGVLANEPSRTIRSAAAVRSGEAQVVRLRLERPRLISVVAEGAAWSVTLGDTVQEPTKALMIGRNIVGPSRISITVPFEEPQRVHRLDDPDGGGALIIVTALGPARGFVKSHDFVDLRALVSAHGVVVQPHADDLKAELAPDKVELSRPGGLTLSESPEIGRRVSITRSVTFDQQLWNTDREAKFAERQRDLLTTASLAPPAKRSASRLDLARFYLSRDMYTEAKAVLDVAIQDDRPNGENPTALVLRSFANIMLDRAESALKDLANPLVGNQHDAQLWRALAYVRQAKWAEARALFREADAAVNGLPLELQRIALKDRLRAAVEVGDFANAAALLNDLETIGVEPESEAEVSVLTGRIAESLGRSGEALAAYRFAAASPNRPAAAQGRLREIVLRQELGETSKTEVVNDLEGLTVTWRGDEIELEALQLLARLYIDDQRYRDAFQIMRTALTVHPNSEMTRRIHDDAAASFDGLFLAGKGDALPPVAALSLFYDFRDLTPVGRRGDEMIRRLADRLVAVDLLDQAAELLQHQVDNRLQGAARAQVATRLAVIYLLARKPDKAQATLRATRTADLSNDLRSQRLLIEARALSDLGRHDLANEVIANINGREAIRLRADIHWAAKNWREAAEQLELLHGERWKSAASLSDAERADILRAGIGYVLANDTIGAGRLREKYAQKMAQGADKSVFDAMMSGGLSSSEIREVARTVASHDTLDAFLRELHARYPEMSVIAPSTPGQPVAGGPMPEPKPDREPTGSIPHAIVPQPVPSRARS